MSDRPPLTLAANGEYFVSGGSKGVQVWRVEDSKLLVTMEAKHVQCVSCSKDGKWIAAGTFWGDVMVWDARIHKQIFSTWKIDDVVRGIDFSPDSTRLVVLGVHTATIWNIATHERVTRPLRHEGSVLAAKYSPNGDQIVTATEESVRVYNSNDARVLVDIPVQVTSSYNTGLLWLNSDLFVVSTDSRIKQIDASTGSTIWESPVPDARNSACIAIPRHGEFIACAANRTVTFWDTLTHTQCGLLRHPQDIYSIALSPDGRFLAIGGEHEKITIKRLSRITEPDIQIDDAVFDGWKRDQLADVDTLLTAAISLSQNPSNHILAGRALVRAHLRQWDEAIADAKESIAVQPSILGYISKSVTLVSKGKKFAAYRACDIAFEHIHSTHISFLLLIKAVIACMAGDYDDAISRVDDLITTLHLNSICYVVRAYMHLLLGNSRVESGNYDGAIRSFERARAQLQPHTSQALLMVSLISGWKFDDLDITIRQCLCEALFAAGRTNEAGKSLMDIVNSVDEVVYMNGPIATWVSDLLQRCLSTLESRSDQVPPFHATLDSQSLTPLLKEWTKLKLAKGSWTDALATTVTFVSSRFTTYRTICEQLDALDKITDATECFHQMMSELGDETNLHVEQTVWVLGFRRDLSRKLEHLGDVAMHVERHQEAISEYSAALSLDPTSPQGLLIKRSKAYVAKGLWENGLQDANRLIELDPLSPWGYERKHAALHKAGRYDDAISTFETMLLKISQSPDPEISERRQEYVSPAQTKAVIRKAVQDAIRNTPRVLIHTVSGYLFDKRKQASLFESLPVFMELVSSMTTHIDLAHIQREVAEYYHYATFSHTWEDNEPLFEKVIDIVVYDLEKSFTHDKLQMFCKIARHYGFYWAWSDTCCINKADLLVLQEALVAMFKWYRGSALTIVFLRGVHSPSQRGDLTRSIWNTRAWTFQEYHACEVVRFYTEDWTPYMNLDIFNHKDSPEIIAEMEEATNISAQALMALRPGLEGIREKLCLASRRETTHVEDAAYSLLGIFSVSLSIVYGEGDEALGRLLAQLLASSGDTSILAWTGKSGNFNSCLPASITVFEQLPTSHIPAITGPEMEAITAALRASSLNFSLVMKLYRRLNDLAVPSLSGKRIKLACITFKLGRVSATRTASGDVFRARTGALGIVEIRTTEDLSGLDSLILVHPWIDFLLDRRRIERTTEMIAENTSHQSFSTRNSPSPSGPSNTARTVRQTRTSRLISRLGQPFSAWAGDTEPLPFPPSISLTDQRNQALEFIARLKQPFGALLLKPTRQNVEEYTRIASESLITVQVKELASSVLKELIDGARTLDVLPLVS